MMTFKQRDNQRGYSVIELLVAAGISGFLTLALAGIMASSKKNYDVTAATTSIQENARFAMKTLSYDLRLAGFYGCSSKISDGSATPVGGVSASGADLASGKGDEITLSFADSSLGVLESTSTVKQNWQSVTLAKFDELQSHWEAGASMVISDCGGAEVVTIDTITETASDVTITFNPPLARNYNNGISAMLFRERAYSIDYRKKDDGDDSTLPALFVSENGAAPVEVATGVEFIRFLYGIDDYQSTDEDILPEHFATWDDYQTELTAGNNGRVVSVQVGLLVQSVSNAKPGDDVNTKYNGATSERTQFQILDIDTDDANVGQPDGLDQALDTAGVSRQAFSNTVAIRNVSRS